MGASGPPSSSRARSAQAPSHREIRRQAGDHGGAENEREPTFTETENLLAHYTTAAVAFEYVLPERRLRLSPYHVMRDPAENKDIVPGTAFRGDQPDAEQGWAEAVAGIKRIRDGCRVLSLTRDEADQGVYGACWARPRMWEQYADVHRGACLVFDRERFVGIARAELNQVGTFWLDEVRYTAAGIAESAARNIIDERIFDPDQRSQAVSEFIVKNSDDFFFLKSSDFQSEHEYRAVLMARPIADSICAWTQNRRTRGGRSTPLHGAFFRRLSSWRTCVLRWVSRPMVTAVATSSRPDAAMPDAHRACGHSAAACRERSRWRRTWRRCS